MMREKLQVFLRFNTRNDNDNPLPWRVLTVPVGGAAAAAVQSYASEVRFETPVITSQDELDPGVFKWHIRSIGYLSWDGDICLVLPEPRNAQ